MFLIQKVRATFRLWLHLYSVFEFPPKSVLLHLGTSWARLEKCMIHSAQFCWEHLLYIFKNFNFWNHIFRFFRFQTQENRFFGLGTFFACFSGSRKSLIYLQFCKFYINVLWCCTKVFPMYVPVNMALAIVQKQL